MMIAAILVLGLLGISIPTVTLQTLSPECLSIPSVPKFDITKYIGLWYEQARYFDPIVKDVKCVTSNYTLNENNTITLHNAGFNAITKKPKALSATLQIADPADPSKFKLKFPTLPAVPEANYWVVATDYNYSVVYACNEVRGTNHTRVWLRTRVRNPSQDLIETALAAATSLKLNTTALLWIDQTNCENDVSAYRRK